MKTNAVIRIVLWSIVIAVLVSVLLWSTGITKSRTRAKEPAATEAPRPLITEGTSPFPVDPEDVYTVLENLNVRSAPSSESKTVAMLEEGTEVALTRMEEIAGRRWGYITEPEQGWVVMDYLQNQSSPAKEPTTPQAPAAEGPGTGYQAYPEDLREISIEWALGDIFIQTADVEKLEVREVNQNQDKVDDMVINSLSRGKLIIRYSEKTTWNFGINIDNTMKKDLYITVPQGFVLNSLEVDAASATLKVQDMTIREMDFDGASGTCDFVNCDIGELDLSTASGDVSFRGTLDSLDCEAVSASVYAVFDNIPRSIEMESVSGDLDITLPENAGFTVTMDAMKSDFVSDFGYSQKRKNTYYRGNGACKISMEAMSGDVYVRKFMESVPQETVTQETVIPTESTVPATVSAVCPVHGPDCDDPSHHSTEPTVCPEHGADCDDPGHHH